MSTTTALHILRPIASFGIIFYGYLSLIRSITRSILLPSSIIGKNLNQLDAI
jgi:hypothetical protein